MGSKQYDQIQNIISENLYIPPDYQVKILLTILIIVVIAAARYLVVNYLINRIEDVQVRYQWRKITNSTIFVLALLLLIREWFGVFESIGTFLGLVSAGLVIAFRDLLVNLGGWLFILFRKPLKVGDRVQVGEISGDVIDIRMFQFSVMEIGNWVNADQSTGRIIHIPNGEIFKSWQANYTAGFEYIWHEIPIVITFESDWKLAKEILTNVLNESVVSLSHEAEEQIKQAAMKFMIFYKTLTPIVYTTVVDHGVCLTLRYICRVRQRRTTEVLLWESILDEFDKHNNIDFAYPTTRFYKMNEALPGNEGYKHGSNKVNN